MKNFYIPPGIQFEFGDFVVENKPFIGMFKSTCDDNNVLVAYTSSLLVSAETRTAIYVRDMSDTFTIKCAWFFLEGQGMRYLSNITKERINEFYKCVERRYAEVLAPYYKIVEELKDICIPIGITHIKEFLISTYSYENKSIMCIRDENANFDSDSLELYVEGFGYSIKDATMPFPRILYFLKLAKISSSKKVKIF